jgi:hypothetical protein
MEIYQGYLNKKWRFLRNVCLVDETLGTYIGVKG